MNIEARKINLVQQIFTIQKESILDKIEGLLKKETLVLSDAQKKSIDEGLLSLQEGNGIPHDQVMEATKLRYPNLFK